MSFSPELNRIATNCPLLGDALKKAQAFGEKYQKINTEKPGKSGENQRRTDLPQLQLKKPNAPDYEENAMKVIEVMRDVQVQRGQVMRSRRLGDKLEKKMENVNFLSTFVAKKEIAKGKTMKNRVKMMRKAKVFPLPKSYTNYKKRKGLLGRNSVKINKTDEKWKNLNFPAVFILEFFELLEYSKTTIKYSEHIGRVKKCKKIQMTRSASYELDENYS